MFYFLILHHYILRLILAIQYPCTEIFMKQIFLHVLQYDILKTNIVIVSIEK